MPTSDIIENLVKLFKEHETEIKKISEFYGPKAVEKIVEMLQSDEDKGAEIYYNAIHDLDLEELLDSAIEDFEEAKKNKKEFRQFMGTLGQGLGIVLKTALKSIIPI